MEAKKIQIEIKRKELTNSHYYDSDKNFIEFIREYLQRSHRSHGYKEMYLNTLNHILNFCNQYEIKNLLTNSIGIEFSENFVHYLREQG